MHVAEPDRCQRGTGLLDLVLMLAQLRDILAAEDSTVVSQEDHDSGIPLPERAETNFIAAGIGQHDICELCTDRFCHAPIISAEIAIAAPTPAFKPVCDSSVRSCGDPRNLLHLSGRAHFILAIGRLINVSVQARVLSRQENGARERNATSSHEMRIKYRRSGSHASLARSCSAPCVRQTVFQSSKNVTPILR